LYESYGMDFDEELRKIKEDAVSSAVNKVETQIEIEQAEFLAAREVGEKVDKEGDYHNALEKAQAIAEELYNADEASRRQVLNQFKLDDYAMYLMVSKLLQEEQEKKSADLAMQQAGLAEGQPGQPGQPGDGSAEDSDAQGPGGSQPPSGESSAPQGPPQADQTPSQKAA
jgi:hypothetical protein